MRIKVLYLPKNFHISPKQISGYATDMQISVGLYSTCTRCPHAACQHWL